MEGGPGPWRGDVRGTYQLMRMMQQRRMSHPWDTAASHCPITNPSSPDQTRTVPSVCVLCPLRSSLAR